ncbi:MAG: F0F1 ATP synthase subunit B [Anaerolineae bacterium]|nr:F0F1 ATP synthase subunit B [Anaerolineae bacterium]
MDKLGINLGYLFLQVVNFIVLVLILRAILYKPMLKMLQERKERIADGLNNALKAEEALARAETDKQKVLDEARSEAQRILGETRARADELAAQIKTETRADAQRVLEEARQDAGDERSRVMADMRGEIVSLSLAAASQLLGTNLDGDRQHQIVEDFFTRIPPEAKGLGGELIVVTAVPLTADEQERFKKELGTDAIAFNIDPGILGGVIIRAGGRQIDGSFAHQLASLRSSLS